MKTPQHPRGVGEGGSRCPVVTRAQHPDGPAAPLDEKSVDFVYGDRRPVPSILLSFKRKRRDSDREDCHAARTGHQIQRQALY